MTPKRRRMKRRANGTGTKPRRRTDGRWQINVVLHGRRVSVYAPSAAGARDEAAARIALATPCDETIGWALRYWLFAHVRKTASRTTYIAYRSAVRTLAARIGPCVLAEDAIIAAQRLLI